MRAALAVALTAALTAATFGACSNGSNTAATATPAPVAAPTGAKGSVVKARFKSAALGVAKDVIVYLPAGYETSGRRYPVYYYLHGLGGDETNWVEGGKLDRTADELGLQAIVVMPDGDDGFYADSDKPIDYAACLAAGHGLFFPERPRAATCVRHSKYETYITRDLVGWVDQTYRTIATREGRSIAGLSMGGFGALQLAMRHPDQFAAAASHSGVASLLFEGPIPYVPGKGNAQLVTDVANWGGRLGPFGPWIRGIFGPELATWQGYDPAFLVAKLQPGAPALYLDCGTEDVFQLHNHAAYVHDLLVARNIDHEFYIGPGAHDFSFWQPRLRHSLAFLASKTAKPQ